MLLSMKCQVYFVQELQQKCPPLLKQEKGCEASAHLPDPKKSGAKKTLKGTKNLPKGNKLPEARGEQDRNFHANHYPQGRNSSSCLPLRVHIFSVQLMCVPYLFCSKGKT